MNKIYKIADLYIRIDYKFDAYFKGNIEKYISNSEIYDHTITTVLCDSISRPIGDPFISKKNRHIYRHENRESLLVLNANNEVDVLIEYDLDYKDVTVFLQKELDNIAEKEYIFTGIMFMDIALSKNYISIHASAISYQGKGILFSAPSKTGKSTHARLWLEAYPDSYIFNDDKPLIQIKEKILVYGTPWSGKTTVNRNQSFPLESIVFLAQGKVNKIKELSQEEKLIHLMRNSNRPRSKELWENNLTSLAALIKDITMYQAHVRKDISSVTLVANTILGDKHENKK